MILIFYYTEMTKAGDMDVSKVAAAQVWGPGFRSLESTLKTWCDHEGLYNSAMQWREADIGRFLELIVQPVKLTSEY